LGLPSSVGGAPLPSPGWGGVVGVVVVGVVVEVLAHGVVVVVLDEGVEVDEVLGAEHGLVVVVVLLVVVLLEGLVLDGVVLSVPGR
jgi:hypothetical protein